MGLFGFKTRRERDTEHIARTQADAIATLQTQLADATKRIEEIRNPPIAEPKCEIKYAGIDDAGNIRIELEWNEEFINELRDAGLTGVDDEAIVNQWIASLVAQQTGQTLQNALTHEDFTTITHQDDTNDATN